jgi:hypothetical protein
MAAGELHVAGQLNTWRRQTQYLVWIEDGRAEARQVQVKVSQPICQRIMDI